nr:protein FAM83F [Misgurnus anguillicaudatus]
MADSQILCMEDGLMPADVPETNPRFYYSERHRVALEELLKNGDGAFKTLLKEEKSTDFLSARELKTITSTFMTYKTDEEEAKPETKEQNHDSKSMRSTYWPEMSDTEVPALDMGWPTSGIFRGGTQITVYTHPPKENEPHIRQVVRKLIQESCKVIAIVMDLLTDIQILQDLFDASKRGVPVYIVLDVQGAPHFLDMCNRLKVGARELKNVRTRTVKGIGLDLSFGKIPGNVHSKYMLIDGDKVVFGTYSYSWSCSRMDRNMITLMSGQVVEFYDNDFRELYAISDKLDLFKEFHLTTPQTGTLSQAAVTRRPLNTTSRFQVNLGDMSRGKVPAHKYHNPKYLLALGQIPDPNPTSTLEVFLNSLETPAPDQQDQLDEQPENPTPSKTGSEDSKGLQKQSSKKKRGFWSGFLKKKSKKENEPPTEASAPTDKTKQTHTTDNTTKQTHTTDNTTKQTHTTDNTTKQTHTTDNTTKQTDTTDEQTDENSKMTDKGKKKKKGLNVFKKAK